MRSLWADDDGVPVIAAKLRVLDPFIIILSFIEALLRAVTAFFTSWKILLMQSENYDASHANSLEIAALELETISTAVYYEDGDEDEEDD